MNGKIMTPPEQPNPWYVLLTNLLPWATLYGLTHTAIYYVFKYWTESRDAAIREIVQEQNKPLEEKIDKLTEMVFELKRK